ncbi:hypothetical protein M8Z33_19805 [Streptomyces sp. ZAF1911]|uniref:hypothetical protein n=1 Tax=Streptomyces sp. ZAF1911 TaxID=2944129 RepID=UPI00237C2084|nr:hypothetical protein [Streptomyces sp. ZAF1911]MDD9378864.1 hypothetical protein [Streptomyces sp. ZAF1911]
MFIRPIGSVVNPSQRPSGHPLLRGILARGAYVWDAAQHPAAVATPQPQDGTAPSAPPVTAPDATPDTRPGPASAPGGPPPAGSPQPPAPLRTPALRPPDRPPPEPI